MDLREILVFLSCDDAARLAGFHAPLLDPNGDSDQGRLRSHLEYLAGQRLESQWIANSLQAGRRDEAWSAAAWAEESGLPLPPELVDGLDAAWTELAREHGAQLQEARSTLRGISDETPDTAAYADQLVSTIEAGAISPRRPRTLGEVAGDLDRASTSKNLRRDVADAVALATEEKAELREKIIVVAGKAFARALGQFAAGSRRPDGPDATLLRSIPELLVSRRRKLLERIARDEIAPTDPEITDSLQGMTMLLPVVAARPLMGAIDAIAPVGAAPVQPRSGVAQELLKRVASGRRLLSVDDLREIGAMAETVTPAESSALYLGAGVATVDRSLRAAALGLGLFAHGHALLDQNQYRFASEELRDAVELLVVARANVSAELIDRAAYALVATLAWPRYRAAGNASDRPTDWVDSPQTMFTWLAANGHLDLLASLWVEFADDAAAAAFFEAVRAELGHDEELLRASAAALISAKRLRDEPERSCARLLWLLKPAEPSDLLRETLERIAQELAGIEDGRPSPATGRFLREQSERLRVELEQLRRDRGAPIDEVIELLPPLLARLVETGEDPASKLVVSPLVGTFYPAERCEEVDLPILLSNEGTETAPNLTFRVAAVGDKPRPTFDQGRDADEQFIGDLQPGETRQVTFAIDLPADLTRGSTEVTFQPRLGSGALLEEQDRFSVQRRPESRVDKTNPYSTGERATSEHFIGREKEVQALQSALLGEGPNRTPIVVGIRRIGKTSIVFKVQEDAEVVRRYLPVYISAEDRPASETTDGFLLYVCEQIRLALPAAAQASVVFHRSEFRERPYDAFEVFVDSLGRSALGGRRVLLILDEVDKLLELARQTRDRETIAKRPLAPQEAFQPEVFGALRKALMKAGALRMVFAGLPAILQATTYHDRLFGLLLPIWVRQFSADEAALVLHEAARSEIHFSEPARNRIFQATGLQPYLLQLVCHNLFARLQTSGRDRVTPDDVDYVVRQQILPSRSYFLDYERLISDEDRPLLRALALVQREVAARRAFVSVHEIKRELYRQGSNITLQQIHERLRSLEADDRPLVVRSRSNAEHYRLVVGMLGERLLRAGDL